jgi:hypothetical protein
MPDCCVVVGGLPSSGKTTYLAALWHLVTARDVPTALRFSSLRGGDVSHLNAIAARWRSARVQERTDVASNQFVSMNLTNGSDQPVRLTFPDVSGEAFSRMWEDRECDPVITEVLRSSGVLLFVHADTIRSPQWIVDFAELNRLLGLTPLEGQKVEWHPRFAPTQVMLIDLLQLLRSSPLDLGPRRLGVMLSAWDKAEGEHLSPESFVAAKLPLLLQYLRHSPDSWTWRPFGVSAQGGDYDPAQEGAPPIPQAEALRALDRASTRIKLVSDGRESHDLTEPIAWLMEQ